VSTLAENAVGNRHQTRIIYPKSSVNEDQRTDLEKLKIGLRARIRL